MRTRAYIPKELQSEIMPVSRKRKHVQKRANLPARQRIKNRVRAHCQTTGKCACPGVEYEVKAYRSEAEQQADDSPALRCSRCEKEILRIAIILAEGTQATDEEIAAFLERQVADHEKYLR